MIHLREYRPADADRLVELANNRNVSRYLTCAFPYPYTREDADWWIAIGARENGAVTKVVEHDGEFVGSIGITPQSGWRSRLAEIGYWLGEPYWGRGIATEALRQMTEHVFASRAYTKLFAGVLEANRPSIAVLEKNGYRLEGVLEKEVVKDGRCYDIHHYARLSPTRTPAASGASKLTGRRAR